jgi:hypothetical protein
MMAPATDRRLEIDMGAGFRADFDSGVDLAAGIDAAAGQVDGA